MICSIFRCENKAAWKETAEKRFFLCHDHFHLNSGDNWILINEMRKP